MICHFVFSTAPQWGLPMSNRIIRLDTTDLRFPTSESLDGSDARNKAPDYSAAYIEMETESGLTGNGLIFTIGRGNDICCHAVESMRHLVVGRDFDDIRADIGGFYKGLRSDSQLQWLGPQKASFTWRPAASSIPSGTWPQDTRANPSGACSPICRLSSSSIVSILSTSRTFSPGRSPGHRSRQSGRQAGPGSMRCTPPVFGLHHIRRLAWL